ncbi:hypothetical protein WM2015_2320 [Wenzhouxiangella marina]|uniref:Lipoprotein n=2 Tax=Wenzhouxiangella marina TaxID=1579979 RepID=A0A0K0XYC5_9GAMM|nr:hypothetical protein WM2015_2320 [Wenzhouxiangella marina]
MAFCFRWAGPMLALLLLTACAGFPEPRDGLRFEDGLTARQWFDRLIEGHGGDLSEDPRDFNLAMRGHWYRAIQRIQPLVTDADYRVTAEERYRPADGLYVVRHEGPAGSKTIRRQGDSIRIWYDGQEVEDEQLLAASAMTTDAFELFHFGPSFLARRAVAMSRLPEGRESGRRYPRLWIRIEPGFGRAEHDEVVAWIDPDSHRLFRVHITLNGFETTQGAHVDTSFADYVQMGGYWIATEFEERVRGPIRIKAHDWQITGRDVGRGWDSADVAGPIFEGAAAAPAGSVRVGED